MSAEGTTANFVSAADRPRTKKPLHNELMKARPRLPAFSGERKAATICEEGADKTRYQLDRRSATTAPRLLRPAFTQLAISIALGASNARHRRRDRSTILRTSEMFLFCRARKGAFLGETWRIRVVAAPEAHAGSVIAAGCPTARSVGDIRPLAQETRRKNAGKCRRAAATSALQAPLILPGSRAGRIDSCGSATSARGLDMAAGVDNGAEKAAGLRLRL